MKCANDTDLGSDIEIDGRPVNGPHSESARHWAPLYEAYVAAGLPAGAPVPDAAAR